MPYDLLINGAEVDIASAVSRTDIGIQDGVINVDDLRHLARSLPGQPH